MITQKLEHITLTNVVGQANHESQNMINFFLSFTSSQSVLTTPCRHLSTKSIEGHALD